MSDHGDCEDRLRDPLALESALAPAAVATPLFWMLFTGFDPEDERAEHRE